MHRTRRHFVAAAAAFAGVLPLSLSARDGGISRLLAPSRPVARGDITPARFSTVLALAAINAVRADRGRAGLAADGTLNALALHQARELVALRTMTHAPRGMQLTERARRVGYRGQVAENLADGYETFEAAIGAWLKSGSHRTTMLSARYTRFGAAVAVAPDAVPGDWGIYWVTEFGN